MTAINYNAVVVTLLVSNIVQHSTIASATTAAPYRFDYSRSWQSNMLLMKCRNATTFRLIKSPSFFINGTRIVEEKFLQHLPDGNFNVRCVVIKVLAIYKPLHKFFLHDYYNVNSFVLGY